jgi:hypothetical protein
MRLRKGEDLRKHYLKQEHNDILYFQKTEVEKIYRKALPFVEERVRNNKPNLLDFEVFEWKNIQKDFYELRWRMGRLFKVKSILRNEYGIIMQGLPEFYTELVEIIKKGDSFFGIKFESQYEIYPQ